MSVKLDPVTLEVIRNALPAIANEMAVDVVRTSYNMMIYEVRDFCTALLEPDGKLVAQNVGGVYALGTTLCAFATSFSNKPPLPFCASILYPMTGDPPLLDGASQDRFTWVGEAAVATSDVTAPGTLADDDVPVGVADTSEDAAPVPI